MLVTAYPPTRDDLRHAGAVWRLFRERPTPESARAASRTMAVTISPNERLQHLFHPWTSYVIVPLFALANAGVRLDAEVLRRAVTGPLFWGIVAGLVLGKPIGIIGSTWLASRDRLGSLPRTVPWAQLAGVATVAGVGFTVSLLIADISFSGRALEEAKIGVLAASAVASLATWGVFTVVRRLPPTAPAAAAALAPQIVDLSDPVDPDVDHVRGPEDAAVTLVEYGDFECPYCVRAEPVVRRLQEAFGDDLRVVFRHLPLVDVHPHAATAAQAAEAAAAQGRFWEMHDLLMGEDVSLIFPDLVRYAGDLGLDVDRFREDLRTRRYTRRINRDVDSADASGAAGTPAFFVNGRRHRGDHDLAGLTAAVQHELGVPV